MGPGAGAIMRWLWSLGIWCLLTTTALATSGFATDGPPEGSPELFGTAESQVGDRGEYKAALVVVEGKQGHWTDMNAKFAFERLPDRWVLDESGTPHAAQSFLTEWRTSPFNFFLDDWLVFDFPSCFDQNMAQLQNMGYQEFQDPQAMEDWGASMEACGDEIAAQADSYAQSMESWFEQGYFDAWDDRTHEVDAGGWQVTHHDNRTGVDRATTRHDPFAAPVLDLGASSSPVPWTTPERTLGPCGFAHGLQGEPVDMWQPVVIQGGCPPVMDFGFAGLRPHDQSATVRVSGTDTVGEWDTTVFSHVDDPDLLRLWFAEEVAYPVRVMTEVEVVPPAWVDYANNGNPPEFYILLELVDYAPGAPADALVPAPQIPAAQGTRQQWGPDDAGFDISWPLSQAFQEARNEPNGDVQPWLDDHPDAAVDTAFFGYQETPGGDDEPIVDETWVFTISDGSDTLQVVAARHTETTVEEPIPGLPTEVREPQSDFEAVEMDGDNRPDKDEQPRNIPTVRSLAARYEALEGQPATGFAYLALCNGDCDDVTAAVILGQAPVWGDDNLRLQAWGAGGRFIGQSEAEGTYPEPTFSEGAWNPQQANGGWGYRVAGAGVWHWPEPVTATSIAAATGFASLLYLLWPLAKGALPMFSRIKREDLLEHPVREGLWELVQNSPGIHFQEIVRQMEKGRGTLEHHLRKLVAADLLVEKSGQGFTCYFPKGQVDRRIMAAAPALKSAGARQLLQAIRSAPGSSAQEVAGRLGMAPSTINYHLKRLVAAELVESQRDGRRVNLHPTALGDQALGQFTPT